MDNSGVVRLLVGLVEIGLDEAAVVPAQGADVDAQRDAMEDAEVVVIGNSDPEFRDVPERLAIGQHLVDLVRVDEAKKSGGSYDGICW